MKICGKEYRWAPSSTLKVSHAAFDGALHGFCGRDYWMWTRKGQSCFRILPHCKHCLKIIEKESKS